MILSTATLTGVTAKPSIMEDINFLTNTDGTTTYLYADRLRNINIAVDDVFKRIIKAQNSWNIDDANYSVYPIATRTINSGVQEVTLPTDLMVIDRVQLKDKDGNWFDMEYVTNIELTTDYGKPTTYTVQYGSVFFDKLLRADEITLTGGIRVYYKRMPYQFTVSDASVSPGYDRPYHRILTYSAARDWFMAKQPEKVALFQSYLDREYTLLEDYYAGKIKEDKATIGRRAVSYE